MSADDTGLSATGCAGGTWISGAPFAFSAAFTFGRSVATSESNSADTPSISFCNASTVASWYGPGAPS